MLRGLLGRIQPAFQEDNSKDALMQINFNVKNYKDSAKLLSRSFLEALKEKIFPPNDTKQPRQPRKMQIFDKIARVSRISDALPSLPITTIFKTILYVGESQCFHTFIGLMQV